MAELFVGYGVPVKTCWRLGAQTVRSAWGCLGFGEGAEEGIGGLILTVNIGFRIL